MEWFDLMVVKWNLMIVHADGCHVDECLLTAERGVPINAIKMSKKECQKSAKKGLVTIWSTQNWCLIFVSPTKN